MLTAARLFHRGAAAAPGSGARTSLKPPSSFVPCAGSGTREDGSVPGPPHWRSRQPAGGDLGPRLRAAAASLSRGSVRGAREGTRREGRRQQRCAGAAETNTALGCD